MDRCPLCQTPVPAMVMHLMADHRRTEDEAMILINRWFIGEDAGRLYEEMVREKMEKR